MTLRPPEERYPPELLERARACASKAELDREIAACWQRMDAAKAAGDWPARHSIMNEICAFTLARSELRDKTAHATVIYTTAKNEEGRQQGCVLVKCSESGKVHGPVWGRGEPSIKRGLWMASQPGKCPCGKGCHVASGEKGVTDP